MSQQIFNETPWWRLKKGWLLSLAVLFFPIVFSLWSFFAYSHPSRDIVPYSSDEMDYWLETRSFQAAGFSMGYFTLNEVTAPIQSMPFGCHGPGFIFITSTIAKLLNGLTLDAGLLYNLFYLTASIALFIWLIQPGIRYLACLLFIVPTFPDVFLYMPHFMQEVIHTGFAFIIAGLFYRLITSERSKWWATTLFFVLIIASYARISWSTFFIPLSLICFKRENKSGAIALMLGLLMMATIYMLYLQTTAPFTFGTGRTFFFDAYTGKTSAGEAINHFIEYFFENIKDLWFGYLSKANVTLWVIICWLTLGMYIILAGSRAITTTNKEPRTIRNFLFHIHFFGLFGIFVLEMIYYGVGTKILITSAIVTFLVTTRFISSPLITAHFIFAQALFFPLVFSSYPSAVITLTDTNTKRERFQSFHELITPLIKYEKNTNRWCNTILMGDWEYPSEFIGLPAGIGVSFMMDYSQYLPPAKSKYLFLRTDKEIAYFTRNNNITYLSHTPIGDLYINNDCQCN